MLFASIIHTCHNCKAQFNLNISIRVNMSASNIVDFHKYGLDVQDISKVDQSSIRSIGKQLVDGFKTHGFCYLKNHGVNETLIKDYRTVSRRFFEQPEVEKEKYPLDARYVFGWVKLERETLNAKRSAGDLHEAFNYTPGYDREWPPVEKFEDLTKEMYSVGKELAYRFCDVLSLGLDLPLDFFRNAHQGHLLEVRSIYYPPITDMAGLAADQVRLGEHTDWGTFAFDFQVKFNLHI